MKVDNTREHAVKPEFAGTRGNNQPAPHPRKEINMGNDNGNNNDEIIDLEEFFTSNKPIPKGKKYRIRIDKDGVVVEVDHLTGRQILALVHKTPEKFMLRQRIGGSVHPVAPDQTVSFLEPGVERFMTIPNEVTEGDGTSARRQFALLQQDEEFLDSLGLRWEAMLEGGVQVVIVYGWQIPAGYNVASADVHVRFSSGYPDTQLDMAYFTPPLARADGRVINNLSTLSCDGRNWQQWSRHRPQGAWRPGIDDLSTHMALVDDWLAAELRK